MTGFNPLQSWFDIIRAPFSGNVDQHIVTPWFSPNVTVNYGGNFEIERRVVGEVASFGRQIGWLGEIVDKLAAGEPPPAEAVDKLRSAMKRIAAIKEQVQADSEDEAAGALDRLERQDRERLRALLERRLRALSAERKPAETT